MDDLIYRQAALEAIRNCTDIFVTNLPPMIDKVDAQEALLEVSSADTEKRTEERTETHARDLIRRQDVRYVEMDEKQEHPTFNLDDAYEQGFADCLEKVLALPPAQPERRKGTWTNDASCPFCGFQPWYERDIHTLSFCPNCGADMRGGEDDHTAEEKAT